MTEDVVSALAIIFMILILVVVVLPEIFGGD